MSITLDTLFESVAVLDLDGRHSFESGWPSSWVSARAEFDRFVEEYERALRLFVPESAVSSDVRLHYEREIEPRLRRIGALLSRGDPELYRTVRGVTDMLLGVLGASAEGSEERESLLYELGLQFIEELKDKGVLVAVDDERVAGATPSLKTIENALAA